MKNATIPLNYHEVFDRANLPQLIVQPSLMVTAANQAAIIQLGLKAGQTLWEYLQPADSKGVSELLSAEDCGDFGQKCWIGGNVRAFTWSRLDAQHWLLQLGVTQVEDQQWYQHIFNQMRTAAIVLDCHHGLQFYNDNGRRYLTAMLGTLPPVGQEVLSRFPPSESRLFKQQLVELEQSGQSYHRGVFRQPVLGQRNRYYEVETLLWPQEDGTNSVVFLIKFQAKHAEQEYMLRQTEAQLQALLDHTSEAIFSIDSKVKLVSHNATFAKLFENLMGEPPRIGMYLPRYLHRTERKRWKRFLAEVIHRKKGPKEMLIQMMNGRSVLREVKTHTIEEHLKSGKPQYVVFFLRDISLQKSSENLLRREELRLQSVFNSITEAICVINNNRRLTLFNREYEYFVEQALGIKPSQGMKVPPIGNSSPERSQWLTFENLVHQKGHYTYTCQITLTNNQPIWYEITGNSIQKDGSSIGKVYFIKNIQSQKEQEESQRLAANQKIVDTIRNARTRANALIIGEEKERARVAKELHDSVGQMLSLMRLQMSELQPFQQTLPTEVMQVMGKLQNTLNETIKEVRYISKNLMPAVLSDYGLHYALQQMPIELQQTTPVKLQTQIHCKNKGERFEPEIELAFYRIAQEAVNNALKHSQAKNIFVQLIEHDTYLELTIEDDGKGFDTTLFQKNPKGLGLKSMSDRAKAIDAEIFIDSHPGKGTFICVQIYENYRRN
ncbi:histidine kinase [Eisenibacter elegans]|uniref:histidine kinase n=1 Tax=Eisenibacter elegans TaxID=997 RepID=UPI00040F473C|nr:histidine kinase [Eisenibacter elegans]